MKFLVSNFSPVNTAHQTFSDKWSQLFQSNNKIDIAVGYASNDSLLYLKKLIELNSPKELRLCLGMATFEGLFASQLDAARELDSFLNDQGYGSLFLCQQFPFHGKVQTFKTGDAVTAGLLGSSNLANIVPPVGISRNNYEVDILLEEQIPILELARFMDELLLKACVPFGEAVGSLKIITDPNRLMEARFDVVIVDPSTKENIWHSKTRDKFEIPVKTTPKSNLNVFFGEGRRNHQGFVRPRHWYEVEIIVGLETQRSGRNYPVNKEFIAYSDDGYKFVLKTSGDYGKNLRSRDDLTLLGRWIKGRMEVCESLTSGQPVNERVLEDYGRDSITLTRTSLSEIDENSGEELEVWAIDFSRPNFS